MRDRINRVAESDLFEFRFSIYRRHEPNARWLQVRAARRWGHRNLARGGNVSAGDGMDGGAIKANIKLATGRVHPTGGHQTSNIRMARCAGGKLRTPGWAHRVSLFRAV